AGTLLASLRRDNPLCRDYRLREAGMTVLGWIVFGLVVGIVAKLLTPGRDPGGFIVTVLLGVAGALLGGFVGRAAGWYRDGDPVGLPMAVVGSIVLLVLYRLVARGPRGA